MDNRLTRPMITNACHGEGGGGTIYASTLSMWFQAAECNAVNASLLLHLINNNFLILFTENLPILNPYLPQKFENLRPHSGNSIENATPL